MRVVLSLVIFLTGLCVAQAAPGTIVECYGQSARFRGFYIHLFENEQGKIESAYTLGALPLYQSPWTNVGTITTPPKSLTTILDQVNQYRDTGLRGDQVALFQNIFIDGSNRWAIELWKLMVADGTVLGWLASAYGERMGCQPHAEGSI